MASSNKPSQPSTPNLSRRRFVQGSSALVMSAPLLAIPAWAQGGSSASAPSHQAPRRLANNPLGFNGARQDPATGLYHLGQGYRVYNPALMRFQACDSMSPFGKGGINAYAYCLGDPVNLRDPSGHFAIASLLMGAAVGAAVGAATSAIGEGIRAGVSETEFEWKQVAFGALLGGISGAFGAAAVGAKAGVKAGLAVGDALVSGAADFGLSVATGSDAKQAAISAGIGAAVGLVSFGAGIGAGKAGEYLSTLDKRLANIQQHGLSGRGAVGGGFPPPDPDRNRLPPYSSRRQRPPRYAKIDDNSKKLSMNNINHIDNNIVIFDDMHKGGLRFNMLSGKLVVHDPHGLILYTDASDFLLDAAGFNVSNGENAIDKYDYIRVLASNSDAFAASLSSLTGKPVKGFPGVIHANFQIKRFGPGNAVSRGFIDKYPTVYSPRKYGYPT